MKKRSTAALLVADKMLLLQSYPVTGPKIHFCSASILELQKPRHIWKKKIKKDLHENVEAY